MKVKMQEVDGIGTSLQGEINISYQDLVSVFGEPNTKNDGYKTDAEWIGTIDGEVFTIYNYKSGKNYLGKDGLEVEEITEWHIGGKQKEVVKKILKYIQDTIVKGGVK